MIDVHAYHSVAVRTGDVPSAVSEQHSLTIVFQAVATLRTRRRQSRQYRPSRQMLSGRWVAFATLVVSLAIAACAERSDVDLLASARKEIAGRKYADAKISLLNVLRKNENHGEARLLLGRLLLDTGDPAGAAIEFRKSIGLNAEEAIPLLARALMLDGKASEVISQFADLEVNEPRGRAVVKSALAVAYSSTGDREMAERQLQDSIAADPTFSTAKVIAGRWKFSAGQYDEALRLVTEVIASNPRDYDAWVLHGEVHQFGRRDLKTATASYQTALEMLPFGVVAHSHLVEIALALDDEAAARKRIDAMSKVLPGSLATIYYKAWVALVDNNLKEAHERIQHVVRLSDKNVKALALAGTIAIRMGNLVEAKDVLTKAVHLDANSTTARLRLSETLLLLGELAPAMESLKPLLALPTPPQGALALEADIRMRTGSVRDSVEFFNRAAQGRSGDAAFKVAAAYLSGIQGRFDSAIKELETIGRIDSTSNRAEMALANLRLKRDDTKGALASLVRAAEKKRDDPLPLLMQGEVLTRMGSLDEARGAFEQAKLLIPSSVGPILGLCELDAALGNASVAVKRLQDWIALNPRNARARLALAQWHQRTGAKPELVTQTILGAVEAAPGDPGPHVALIRYQLASRNFTGALASAQLATARTPGNADVLAVLADAQLAMGDVPGAIRSLTALVGIRPWHAPAHAALGRVVLMANDKQAARPHFEKALEINPELIEAHQGIVESDVRGRRFDTALAHAVRVQQLFPKVAQGWQLKGDVHMAMGQWDNAVTAYRSAQERDPNSSTARRLHDALIQGGKFAEAARHAADWRARQPGDMAFVEHLGTAALKRGEYPLAESYYQDVLAKEPKSVLALNNMAVSQCKQGKASGMVFVERADKLSPDNPAILDSWAECAVAANELAKALDLQRKALALEPKSPLLNFHLAQVALKSGNKQLALSQLQKLGEMNIRYVQSPEVEAFARQLR